MNFRSRMYVDERTLSPADLLLTKMQIVEVNEKDLLDVVALFIDYDVVENDQGINFQYISKLTSNDWGLQKTLGLNLVKAKAFAIERNFFEIVSRRIDTLIA